MQLVHPETKQPYKEHEKDGKCYAEVEPDAEYVIQFEVLRDPVRNSRTKTMVYVTFEVDGTNLDYYQTLREGDSPEEAGYYEYRRGVEVETALRFARPTVAADVVLKATEESPATMGKVSVCFSEAVYQGTRQRNSAWTSDTPTSMVNSPFGEGAHGKVVRSEQGSWSQCSVVREEDEETTYTEGSIYETLTIHCCTAHGLVVNGVIQKPPLWEYHRLRAPLKQSTVDPEIANLVPQIMKVDPVEKDGIQMKPGAQYEYFDLSHLATDSDSEDDYFPLDLTRVVNNGILPVATGPEKSVDRYFIENFHGKPFESFQQNYKRLDALRQTAADTAGHGADYELVLRRHEVWESQISASQSQD